ncbi:MAG: NADH-quinone oxidoreductase subunit L [Gammaproteobacteria bacterium]|nr:MAG: NADH-quinone oxidoreductase subunit L [Gammaproteobacteria bacterium]
MEKLYLWIAIAPLIGAIIAGLFGKQIGKTGAHIVTIAGVGFSTIASMFVLKYLALDGGEAYNASVYTWAVVGDLKLEVGFLVDNLTAMMMVVVTFVSLMVHIYTIGYMKDDPGYQRFFCYISLFTFSMLMLVMANNFLQLFFGWEAVGLVSYLLIGFWYKRDTAIYANLKAFMVNRVGDFGFLLGIAGVLYFFGSLDYATVFGKVEAFAATNATFDVIAGSEWSAMTVICICLFIGAMGKSAQVPLHVWLPDSMEGPTPISALIHAATMVTAGVFMVARMSPLFEHSETALAFILVIGATTALFMGFLGLVQNDIKRVIAYSTLSQLGYMVVALGSSAYAAGVYHLMTHAFFKALLFLAAGSVIIGMHHEQDMRKMGGLYKYMPITWITCLIGSLALIGTPFFSGYYSKDVVILAAQQADLGMASTYAYYAVLSGVFITALYSFRLFFMVFHSNERFDDHTREHLKESPWVVTLPLILLAIPSVIIAWFTAGDMLFGDFFDGVIFVLPQHDVLNEISHLWKGPVSFGLHALSSPPFYLALAGVVVAWVLYVKRPDIPGMLEKKFKWLHTLFVNKYYFDEFNQALFADGTVKIGKQLWKYGDQKLIDGLMVDGTAKSVGVIASVLRRIQTGQLSTYAFSMIIGLVGFLGWLIYASM